jgi:hypothetical protein
MVMSVITSIDNFLTDEILSRSASLRTRALTENCVTVASRNATIPADARASDAVLGRWTGMRAAHITDQPFDDNGDYRRRLPAAPVQFPVLEPRAYAPGTPADHRKYDAGQ